MNHLRKTHPMVLIAAIALTIFSLVGSAAITGLIPSAPPAELQSRTTPTNPQSPTMQGQMRKESPEGAYQRTQRAPSRTIFMVRA
jgi:hypothetical protein